MIFNTV